jgi:hypothetical protein
MNRSDIGDYLSLATETVSRVFVQFQENGWITIAGKQISINQERGPARTLCPLIQERSNSLVGRGVVARTA